MLAIMSQRIDPDAAVTVTVGIRLPPTLLKLLDAEVDLANASVTGAQATRASVARALFVAALQERAAAQPRSTTPSATAASEKHQQRADQAPERTEIKQPRPPHTHRLTKKPVRSKTPPLRETLLDVLRAHTPKSKAQSIMVAPVVRELAGRGHEQTLVLEALLALDREGVLELRPESGAGLLAKKDAALCPQGPTGTLSSAVWR